MTEKQTTVPMDIAQRFVVAAVRANAIEVWRSAATRLDEVAATFDLTTLSAAEACHKVAEVFRQIAGDLEASKPQ